MFCQRRIYNAGGCAATRDHISRPRLCSWSLFSAVPDTAALNLKQSTMKGIDMKKLSVVVAGTGQIQDLEIQSGTTAGDVLHQLNLQDYLLSKGPNEPFFAAAESIY